MKIALCALLLTQSLSAASPQTPDIDVSSVYVPMKDGVRIAIEVLLPAGMPPQTKLPALFRIARFGRADPDGSIAQDDRFWVTHGYARVLVDARGTGASFGTSTFGPAEVGDLRELVDWVVKRPWSNGRVGAIGISVEGTASELIAATGHPAVRAVAPWFSDFDYYTDLIRPGGVYSESLMKSFGAYTREMDGGAAAKRVSADSDGSLLKQAIADHKSNVDLHEATRGAEFADDPLLEPGKSLLDISIPALAGQLKKSQVPMLILASWFDAGTVQGALRRYRDFGNVQRVLIEASSHGGNFNANPFDPTAPADPGHDGQLAEALTFFDHYLKDVRSDAVSAPRGIRYFTVGTNRWQTTDVWPPAGLGKVIYHLDSGGSLTPKAPSGKVEVELKNTATGEQSRWHTQFGGNAVVYGTLPSVTSFTTTPLEAPLEITGQPILRLQLSCAAADPSLFAYLMAVDANGKALYLTEGQLRLIDRKLTFLRRDAQPVPKDEPVDVTLTLLPISAVVPKGWRLQLLLASGDTSSFATSGPYKAAILPPSFIELPAATRPAAVTSAPTSSATLTSAQWHDDLRFLARELPKRHANAFHHTARERFDQEVAALDKRIDTLDPDAIYVGLSRVVELIGDAHTSISLPKDSRVLPIAILNVQGDYRVVGIDPAHEQALRAHVVKVEDTPLARVQELIEPLTPADEPRLREYLVPQYLSSGLVLHGLGIAPDRDRVHFTLADDDGHEFVIELRSGPAQKLSRAFAAQPLYRQNPDKRFWFTYLPESRAIYCSFRGYQDLAANAKALLKLVNEKQPDKLIIDLRQNGGGDYTQGLRYLVDPIAKLPNVNKKGHLFVLIGPQTFSAAMSNAAHFRQKTEATLVGRTIAEKPNSYQEPDEMSLPNSKLVVHYSTKYYEFVKGGENALRPDQEILTTWEDYKAGRDPALEWVLRQP